MFAAEMMIQMYIKDIINIHFICVTHPRIAQVQFLEGAFVLPHLGKGILEWCVAIVQLVDDLFTFEFETREAFGQQRHFTVSCVFYVLLLYVRY